MNIEERIHRLIDLTARVESGGDYSKWNPDDNGHGPSFGLIQFNATVGSLGKLIVMMREAKPEWWVLLFADSSPPLEPGNQDHAKAWGQAVAAGSPSYWKALLQLSGQVPIWQQCQRQLAREEYFDPAARLCARFGLTSERAHAMAFDVAVQYGVAGLERMFNSATTYTPTPSNEHAVLGLLASYGDRHEYDQQRRHKLLSSAELSDGPMFPKSVSETSPPTETRPTLRKGQPHGGYLKAIQEQLVALGYLKPAGCRGDFGPALEEAVRAFQAEHGLHVDGIVGPATWAALDQAAKEGGGK